MKLSNLKHNHSLTDLLKILIFAILMLAPIGAVATRCMYVICNKNAYQSYYGETINEEIDTTIQPNEMVTNTEYLMTTNTTTYDFVSNYIYITCNYLYNYNNDTEYTDFDMIQINGNTANYLALYNNGNYVRAWQLNATTIYKFKFLYNGGTRIDTIPYTIQKQEFNKNSYLDNVFEYSVNELENSQLFNWTENTAVYTGVKAMTTQLQITGNVIPILITYWFLLTIIYVIIDIVLKLFTVLTHMIGNKQA